MFSVNILHRLRPCIVSQSFRYIHITTARHGAPFPVSNSRGVSGNQLCTVRRSFLSLNNKVQSHCPSTRFLSAPTHSEDGDLIYTGNLGRFIRMLKMMSYSTSGASLFIIPYFILNSGLAVQSFAIQASFCGMTGFFTFLSPVLIYLITKGYVIRLYHNPDRDTYTAITYSIFLTEKKRVFHQSQVKVPDVSKIFTTFYVNNMGLLVNPDLFTMPHNYSHLMGYDKPFSFETDDMDRPNES